MACRGSEWSGGEVPGAQTQRDAPRAFPAPGSSPPAATLPPPHAVASPVHAASQREMGSFREHSLNPQGHKRPLVTPQAPTASRSPSLHGCALKPCRLTGPRMGGRWPCLPPGGDAGSIPGSAVTCPQLSAWPGPQEALSKPSLNELGSSGRVTPSTPQINNLKWPRESQSYKVSPKSPPRAGAGIPVPARTQPSHLAEAGVSACSLQGR